jgi:hypothetical protein
MYASMLVCVCASRPQRTTLSWRSGDAAADRTGWFAKERLSVVIVIVRSFTCTPCTTLHRVASTLGYIGGRSRRIRVVYNIRKVRWNITRRGGGMSEVITKWF